jgi:hypothetical protein
MEITVCCDSRERRTASGIQARLAASLLALTMTRALFAGSSGVRFGM